MMGSNMSGMMGGGGMHGMMEQRMEHMFYLDRADALGLSADQVSRLKAIHVDCRKKNIRNMAEAKIARLELSELLAGDSWTMKDAEALVRKVQTLEGDIQVRHLQAVSDARKVLTAEQRQQAQADESAGNLESLFE
ncbi:MAG: periplasmic heavy metal sensor [Desulfuromonadales bacterium]|nr:periplasmic heavy metal sensor [Desulfuromonadales bacterium]